MIEGFFIVIIIVNLSIVMFYLKKVHSKEGFIGPLFFFLSFYVLNYPIRATMLFLASGSSWEWQVDEWGYRFQREEILFSLAYATLFMGILVGYYEVLCRRRRWLSRHDPSPASGLANPLQKLVFLFMFGAYVILFVYRLSSGKLVLLYESMDALEKPFMVNVFYLADFLKWFLTAYGLLRFLRVKSIPALILALTMFAIIVFSAVASTAKGDLVTLVMIGASCVWLVKGRLPKYTILVCACVVILFAFYSHTARRVAYENVRSAQGNAISNTRWIVDLTVDAYESGAVLWEEQAIPLFNRFCGTDTLALCQRKGTFFEDGLYVVGSVVEFGNIIPRLFWPDRPHLSFNHHMTSAIWGISGILAEMPIGRIGESFFVLNWGGIFYAFLYASFWNWLYVKFLVQAQDDLKRALYACLVCLVVIPDAYLIYNWKSVVVVGLSYSLVKLARRSNRPSSRLLSKRIVSWRQRARTKGC